jgi:tetratricopeptide (TPR) repeat protein
MAMARDPKAAEKNSKVTPDWEKVLYTPERVQKYLEGQLTGQQLHAVTGPEMLQMALIGFQMYEAGKFEESRVLFEGLIQLDPNESYYPTALGAVYLAMDELDAAEGCFDRAIKLNPKELASFVNRGEVHLRNGKVMEAAQDFKAAVDLDPKGKEPLTARARLLAAAALETIEQARAEAAPASTAKKK